MQDIEFDRGVWAVVAAPGFGLLIGALHFPDILVTPSLTEDSDKESRTISALMPLITEHIPILIDPCFSFKADSIMVQTEQGPATTYMRQCTPLANCVGPGKLRTAITSALLFNEMEKHDRERHKSLVQQLITQLMHARMQAAGITPAKPGDMPSGPVGQPRQP